MNLIEMYNIEPKFAWLEPAKGPGGTTGVRLAFIEPVAPKLDSRAEDALQKNDKHRAERAKMMKDNYIRQGEKYFLPDLGWWANEGDFHDGKPSFKSHTKGNIFQKYPNLQVFPSRKEAEKAAKAAGDI